MSYAVNAVLESLSEGAEASAADVARDHEIRRDIVSSAMRRMNGHRRIFIVRWVFDADGLRNYPRPVYKMGRKGSNAPKPIADQLAVKRRYEAKRRGRVASVFDLGAHVAGRTRRPSVIA